VVNALNDTGVHEAISGQIITAITEAPSARCMGCFALNIQTLDSAYKVVNYNIDGQELMAVTILTS